jgi:hypothetical protein
MPIEEKSETEILQIVNPIMDNLMEASTRIDHARHTRDFTERLKAIVTEDYLKKVCTKYQSERGYFGERRFVALFRRPGAVAVVWNRDSRSSRVSMLQKRSLSTKTGATSLTMYLSGDSKPDSYHWREYRGVLARACIGGERG